MPLRFQPRPGSVVYCDFRGYEVPEIVKRRPVVVIAARRSTPQLVTVVPLSTKLPLPARSFHYRLQSNPLPGWAEIAIWAKCDLINTVSLRRLDRVRFDARTRRIPRLPARELASIEAAVLAGLGFRELKRTDPD